MKYSIKIYLCIITICIINFQVEAQRRRGNHKTRVIYQLGAGYNLGGFQLEGLNNVIDLFNFQNPNAHMENIENLGGVSASLNIFGHMGGGKKGRAHLYFDLMYNNRSLGTEGLNQINNQVQNIRFRSHNLGLSFGLMPIISDYFNIAVAVSGDVGYNSQLISYDNTDLENIQDDITGGMSVSLPIIIGFGEKSHVALSVRPFYQMQFSDIDFNKLNQEINRPMGNMPPSSSQYDFAPEDFISNTRGWGVAFHFYLMLYKDYHR